jgi:CRP-like cAMP-binding protein
MALEHIAHQAQEKMPILRGFEGEAFGKIFIMLVPLHFVQDELIYQEQDLGGSMYFILNGSVQISSGSSNESCVSKEQFEDSIYEPLKCKDALDSQSAEPFFGQMSLFHEVCKIRPETAKASPSVETLCLSREVAIEIRAFCPEFYEHLFNLCLLSASRHGVNNETIVSDDNRTRARGIPKIEQICSDLRKDLMNRHKQILKQILLKGKDSLQEGCAGALPTDALSVNPSFAPNLLECDILVGSNGMIPQEFRTSSDFQLPDLGLWREGILSITDSLEIWCIVDDMAHLIESRPKLLGTLVIHDQFQNTCQVWKLSETSSPTRPSVVHVGHMGVVKKRGQINTAFKTRYFVLSDARLEYYEDEKTYLVAKTSGLKGGLKGSVPTRNVKIMSGAGKTDEGYHFTIEDTSRGILIECACEEFESRDAWVQKIEASHDATVQCEKINTARFQSNPDSCENRHGCFLMVDCHDGNSKGLYLGCQKAKEAHALYASILQAVQHSKSLQNIQAEGNGNCPQVLQTVLCSRFPLHPDTNIQAECNGNYSQILRPRICEAGSQEK